MEPLPFQCKRDLHTLITSNGQKTGVCVPVEIIHLILYISDFRDFYVLFEMRPLFKKKVSR
jgi:hypothetical protein